MHGLTNQTVQDEEYLAQFKTEEPQWPRLTETAPEQAKARRRIQPRRDCRPSFVGQ
jgi:hypothetical protein